LPFVNALRNPGLRQRHWQQITALAPEGLPQDTELSLGSALAAGLGNQLAALSLISDAASREYTLERALDKMQVHPPFCLLFINPGRVLIFSNHPYSRRLVHFLVGDKVLRLVRKCMRFEGFRLCINRALLRGA
jgi:Dynein heavy chain, N-terminal region 2